jgi:hypothetical protein
VMATVTWSGVPSTHTFCDNAEKPPFSALPSVPRELLMSE